MSTPDSPKPVQKQFPKHLVEIYVIDGLVGQGAFSTVWKAVHRTSGQVRAVKKIDTSELSPREIAHEIALMRLLRHENVVRCYDVFLEAQFVNIVVDMFNGGDLVDGLNAHRRAYGRVPNGQLAHLARQMMEAVKHVHSLQIIHRDVKGENFLSDRPDIGDPGCKVALADFGTAIRVEAGEKLCNRVGTPAFWAPEIFRDGYSFPVDVWAVGVTTFILLTGALPFEGEEAISRETVDGQPPFAVPYYSSQLCTSFIAACLTKDPRLRPLASEASRHAWLTTSQSPGREGVRSATPEQVSTAAAGAVLTGLSAVVVGLCQGMNFCMDLLVGTAKQVTETASRPSKAVSEHLSTHTAPPEKDVIEKQMTDLTKQISVNLMEHQVSQRKQGQLDARKPLRSLR
eukprot:TRINITY_DN34698_c0_g1_i1.p1 TRINITY_DN34698_c0_g1~~TRINITY_DN34698_c0_g1_i1.p1  ORF type:complete len:409 (+),score=70.67 TRINITY_DN34698_c0_g1_i1:30-1229(+)